MRAWSEQQAQERVARKGAEDGEAAAYWAYLQRVRDGTFSTLFNNGTVTILPPERACASGEEGEEWMSPEKEGGEIAQLLLKRDWEKSP